MSDALVMVICASVGFCLAMAIANWTGLSDSLEKALNQPQPVTSQQLEDLCISGNANACKVYEVRYEKRCIL